MVKSLFFPQPPKPLPLPPGAETSAIFFLLLFFFKKKGGAGGLLTKEKKGLYLGPDTFSLGDDRVSM